MTQKELSEIRRLYKPEKNNISHVRGCYVNEKGEILSEFHQSLTEMPQEESEKLLSILKKTLSGTLGKNLVDISFSTHQVMEGEEHKLLRTLRESSLKDEEAVQAFYQKVIAALALEENYLILLAFDAYDVPYRPSDGGSLEDASEEIYSYFLCSICPVKRTKPALSYSLSESQLHNCQPDWIVSPPELGFLFPAFDDRRANLYNALYYSRKAADSHPEFIETVFQCQAPMPADLQKETFQSILSSALAEDCRLPVVQAVQEQLCEMIEEGKKQEEELPAVSKGTVKAVLESCGISEPRIEAFIEKFDAEFGADTQLNPQNLMDPKQMEVSTADVTIRVRTEKSDLVETRILDGAKYILIRAEEGAEVNGVPIQIS